MNCDWGEFAEGIDPFSIIELLPVLCSRARARAQTSCKFSPELLLFLHVKGEMLIGLESRYNIHQTKVKSAARFFEVCNNELQCTVHNVIDIMSCMC